MPCHCGIFSLWCNGGGVEYKCIRWLQLADLDMPSSPTLQLTLRLLIKYGIPLEQLFYMYSHVGGQGG